MKMYMQIPILEVKQTSFYLLVFILLLIFSLGSSINISAEIKNRKEEFKCWEFFNRNLHNWKDFNSTLKYIFSFRKKNIIFNNDRERKKLLEEITFEGNQN